MKILIKKHFYIFIPVAKMTKCHLSDFHVYTLKLH